MHPCFGIINELLLSFIFFDHLNIQCIYKGQKQTDASYQSDPDHWVFQKGERRSHCVVYYSWKLDVAEKEVLTLIRAKHLPEKGDVMTLLENLSHRQHYVAQSLRKLAGNRFAWKWIPDGVGLHERFQLLNTLFAQEKRDANHRQKLESGWKQYCIANALLSAGFASSSLDYN